MFLGLAIQEALGMAFALVVIVWSFWCVYKWVIKPDRERRRQDAAYAIEEMHRHHSDHLRTRWQREFGKEKPSEEQKT